MVGTVFFNGGVPNGGVPMFFRWNEKNATDLFWIVGGFWRYEDCSPSQPHNKTPTVAGGQIPPPSSILSRSLASKERYTHQPPSSTEQPSCAPPDHQPCHRPSTLPPQSPNKGLSHPVSCHGHCHPQNNTPISPLRPTSSTEQPSCPHPPPSTEQPSSTEPHFLHRTAKTRSRFPRLCVLARKTPRRRCRRSGTVRAGRLPPSYGGFRFLRGRWRFSVFSSCR